MNFRLFQILWCKIVIKKIFLFDILRIRLSKSNSPVKKRCLDIVQYLGNFGYKGVPVNGHLFLVMPVPPSNKD